MRTKEQLLDIVYPAAREHQGRFLDAELLRGAARIAWDDDEPEWAIVESITIEDCQQFLALKSKEQRDANES